MSLCVIVANRMPCFVATAPNMLYELLINLSTPFPKILDTPLHLEFLVLEINLLLPVYTTC